MFVLVVADRDFGELIFHQGLVHVGVMFFRLPGAQLPAKIDQLKTALQEHAEVLESGAFLGGDPWPDSRGRSSSLIEL